MFGIFRGHQPAPVPDKAISLPATPVTPKQLKEKTKAAWAEAVERAASYHLKVLGPKFEKFAQEGKTETYVTASDFGAPIAPLVAYLRSLGYVVSDPYSGGSQANVEWG